MGVRVLFKGAPLAGKSWDFDDDVEQIVIGRNPDKCQIVLPADMTGVGRQHVALEQQLGRYRLILSGANAVYVDGESAMDDLELPADAMIQLGKDGPILRVLTMQSDSVPPTVGAESAAPGVHTRLAESEQADRRHRWLFIAISGLVVAIGIGLCVLWYVNRQYWERIDKQVASIRDDVKKDVDAIVKAELDTVAGLEGDRKELARLVAEQQALERRLAEMFDNQKSADRERKDITAKLQDEKTDLQQKIETLTASVAAESAADPTWAELSESHNRCVFLIVAEGTDPGHPTMNRQRIGTAFCIDKEHGILATNAHIVEILELYPTHRAYQGWSGLGFEIVRYARHEAWDWKQPNLPAPDVGLVQIALPGGGGAGPEALELATQSEVLALRVGTFMGTLGYPEESIARFTDWSDPEGGLAERVKSVAPVMHAGMISSLTSYDWVFKPIENAHYIHHTAPTSPGTSGSPLFTLDGKVVGVHHAGQTTTGLLYGVRIDELTDFWDGLKRENPKEWGGGDGSD